MPRRLGRTIAVALLIAFLFGLLIGTWLRRELERPIRYVVETSAAPACEHVVSLSRSRFAREPTPVTIARA